MEAPRRLLASQPDNVRCVRERSISSKPASYKTRSLARVSDCLYSHITFIRRRPARQLTRVRSLGDCRGGGLPPRGGGCRVSCWPGGRTPPVARSLPPSGSRRTPARPPPDLDRAERIGEAFTCQTEA